MPKHIRHFTRRSPGASMPNIASASASDYGAAPVQLKATSAPAGNLATLPVNNAADGIAGGKNDLTLSRFDKDTADCIRNSRSFGSVWHRAAP